MTCWRRLREWNEAGVWQRLHELLLAELRAAGMLDFSRAAVDSSHLRALPLERSAANLMFQLVSKRYETGPILLTSNKIFKDWGEIFSDTALATAILDRLPHHCETIAINGPSLRHAQPRYRPGHYARRSWYLTLDATLL